MGGIKVSSIMILQSAILKSNSVTDVGTDACKASSFYILVTRQS